MKTPSSAERGFTFIALLVAMLLLSLATQGVMTSVSQQSQREREADLLRIGQIYVQAIGAYYEASPGVVKRWPTSLEDLLEDRRLVTIKRHLREIYPDPVSRTANWGLIRDQEGGIIGVHSQSEVKPIRTGIVDMGTTTLPPATRYADWQFVYQPMASYAPAQ
jgi:type II secretory pathway pseudopilin PulG